MALTIFRKSVIHAVTANNHAYTIILLSLTLTHEKDISAFEKRRSERYPWLDGIGYSGKIPINVEAPKSKKMEW
jgi:hypothetical protein